MVAVSLCSPVATWEFLPGFLFCFLSLTLPCSLVFWMPDNNATDGAGSETSIKVEVKRLDYGDTACLSLLNTKEMTPEMALLPLQAVQVSLTNVSGSLLIMFGFIRFHMYLSLSGFAYVEMVNILCSAVRALTLLQYWRLST